MMLSTCAIIPFHCQRGLLENFTELIFLHSCTGRDIKSWWNLDAEKKLSQTVFFFHTELVLLKMCLLNNLLYEQNQLLCFVQPELNMFCSSLTSVKSWINWETFCELLCAVIQNTSGREIFKGWCGRLYDPFWSLMITAAFYFPRRDLTGMTVMALMRARINRRWETRLRRRRMCLKDKNSWQFWF